MIVGESKIIQQVIRMANRIAPSNASVLILGETGTGKELLADYIYNNSSRPDKPFVTINCGALREALLESELFGHEKGAFTGAYSRKIGLIEMANGGTLFLDEIGELSPNIQKKLLRFLQEGEFYRVGGKEVLTSDVRIISATNRELDAEVMRGNFREDLYYRINTITMHSPPLRRRKDDIIMLAEHFLEKPNLRLPTKKLSPNAADALIAYDWPGNIRELQNTCERLRVLADQEVVYLSDLPKNIVNPQEKEFYGDYDPNLTLYEIEKQVILKSMEYFEGNKTQAANALGITVKTLYNKLYEYGEFERYRVRERNNGSE